MKKEVSPELKQCLELWFKLEISPMGSCIEHLVPRLWHCLGSERYPLKVIEISISG